MVAPNSPMALANDRIIPATIPGRVNGSVIVQKTQAGFAPSVPAAASSLRSTASMDSRMARTIRGKPITPQARAAPVQRNENTMPKLGQKGPRVGPLAKGQEQ